MAAEISLAPRNKVSLGTARVVPAVLALIVAYATYVVVGPLTINYLLDSPDDVQPRIAAGIAIPIVWLFLLTPVAATYLRLLLVVFLDPGYVPQGDETLRKEPPPDFWMRDVFVCDANGIPIWCHHCRNWKPDRAHHNQDSGRCTLKMDHFCPWVGGVVGERSHKFFLQFLIYAMILTAYLTALMAFFVHKTRHRHSNVHFYVALGVGAFFLLFTLGMVVTSIQYAAMGWTTIEQAGRNSSIHLAVLLPPELQASLLNNGPTIPPPATTRLSSSRSGPGEDPFISEIDDPSHSLYFSNNGAKNWALRRASRSEFWRGTITYPLSLPTDRPPLPAPEPRIFAILETPRGMNPWDLGSASRNLGAVFGTKLHHWVLPVQHSPCCDHSSQISFYPLGPQFEDFLEDAGLVQPLAVPASRGSGKESTLSERRKRRKRRLERGWQNGERPDYWWGEKEARRREKEARRRAMEGEVILASSDSTTPPSHINRAPAPSPSATDPALHTPASHLQALKMASGGGFAGGKRGGTSGAKSSGSSKTARENATKGIEKKAEKKPVKETRPKILERLAKKVVQKEKKVEKAASGEKSVKGDKEAMRERGNFVEEE
ncbi:Palmitoyltransferase pfa5 [Teratosphaeriaceae sp. CCFEE 6253]|nr:Palmitoyltransferase pfa5 [Teratosphaeriaceae sp. CCFEE 6253]